jgi:L-histidine N-alpha-methyltransferase
MRFNLTIAESPAAVDFAAAVRAGLTAERKFLPCRFFYDREGSRLFERICALPEYYLTRAEREILADRAAEIAACCGSPASVVELGSGSAEKTRLLLDALLRGGASLRYVPIDICRAALERSAAELLERYAELEIRAIAAEYADGLRRLRRGDGRRGATLVLFLGSNIGNLDRTEAAAFLGGIRGWMEPDDRLLLGVDLRKSRAVLEAAYDDAAGVTARFNLNLLARINRELGGRFDPDAFRHRAEYLKDEGRIVMWLVSRRRQRVAVEALELEVAFEEGESIHTENSFKYSSAEIDALARAAGLSVARRWTDRAGRFAENLLAPGERRHFSAILKAKGSAE